MGSPAEPVEGLYLWLAPGGEEAESLSRLVLELSRRLGTPRFDPHLTLLGGLPAEEVEDRSARLAAGLDPLPLRFRGLDGEAAFYRCLYGAVEGTPALLSAHEKARALFAAPPAAFQPHLSLVYGRLDPEARRALMEAVAPRLPAQVTARHLDLIRTGGGPEAWRRLRRFDLGRRPG